MTGKEVHTEAVVKIQGLNYFRQIEFQENEASIKTETRKRFGEIQYTSIQVGDDQGEKVTVQVRTDALIQALENGGLIIGGKA